MKLLLFDIDGTLVRTAGIGRDSMEEAFEQVFGPENGLKGIEMMGRTDPSILKEVLENHNLEWSLAKELEFKEIYFNLLEKNIDLPKPGKRLCPGILELLTQLNERADIALGLLTGNWRYGSYLKLKHFHIDDFFSIGAFSDDSEDRNQLVPFAVNRFEKEYGQSLSSKDIFVIGDTPKDIACAKPHNAHSVAVATGFHDMETLKAAKPDFLFENFEETEKVVQIFSN